MQADKFGVRLASGLFLRGTCDQCELIANADLFADRNAAIDAFEASHFAKFCGGEVMRYNADTLTCVCVVRLNDDKLTAVDALSMVVAPDVPFVQPIVRYGVRFRNGLWLDPSGHRTRSPACAAWHVTQHDAYQHYARFLDGVATTGHVEARVFEAAPIPTRKTKLDVVMR